MPEAAPASAGAAAGLLRQHGAPSTRQRHSASSSCADRWSDLRNLCPRPARPALPLRPQLRRRTKSLYRWDQMAQQSHACNSGNANTRAPSDRVGRLRGTRPLVEVLKFDNHETSTWAVATEIELRSRNYRVDIMLLLHLSSLTSSVILAVIPGGSCTWTRMALLSSPGLNPVGMRPEGRR
jgi:hypothetical protein